MIKRSSLLVFCALFFLFSIAGGIFAADKKFEFDNISGYFDGFSKSPPIIRLRTEQREYSFPFTKETIFTDLNGEEIAEKDFVRKYKGHGVLLILDEGKITEITPVFF